MALAERISRRAAERDPDGFLREIERAAAAGETALRGAVVQAITSRLDAGDWHSALAMFRDFRSCSTVRVDALLERLAREPPADDPVAKLVRRELLALTDRER